jgi:hypothetical protein
MEKNSTNIFLVNTDAKGYSNCDIAGSFYEVVYKNEDKACDAKACDAKPKPEPTDEMVGKPKESGK